MSKKLLKNKNLNRAVDKRGFTLFISLVVTSLLLAVGFSIGSIVQKQLILASTGKESQLAFFAADSGAECALYWDRKNKAGDSVVDGEFATSSLIALGSSNDIQCGGQNIEVTLREVDTLGGLAATTSFSVNFSSIGGVSDYKACARVTVIKDGPYTQIDSRGYNALFDNTLLPADCNLDNPRTLERGLQLNY